MASTVTYKGATLTTVNNQTRTLLTAGKYMEDDVTIVDVSGSVNLESKSVTITPTESSQSQTVTPTTPTYDALSSVSITVNPISSTYVGSAVDRRSSSNISIVGDVLYAQSGYYQNAVNEPLSNYMEFVTPSASASFDSATGLFTAIATNPSTNSYAYIHNTDSDTDTYQLTVRNSSDLDASGDTVTAPAGYYPSSATKSVASGTAGTPTATKGAVNNHSISVTPSVTNTAGYISGGTINGTAVTVTASELVSGNLPITSNGNNIDVTNYATVSVNVAGQSKNVQIASGVNRIASTSYTAVSGQTLTVSKTGTYDVYWTGYRSSTGGTNGSQLYIGNTAYGSAQTTFSNNAQSVHLSNVSLTQNQTITVRARSRGNNYYMYVSNLTIIEA